MKKGFTLIEIVIAMGVGAIIIFLTLTTFNRLAYKSFIDLGNQSELQSNSTANLDRIAKYLRQSSFIEGAATQSVTFFSYATDDATIASKMRFFLLGGVLKQGIILPTGTSPNYTYSGANETFYTLSTKVATNAGVIFTYYDNDGNILSQPVATNSVTMIKINLPYKPSGLFSPEIATYSTSIQFRNRKTNL